MEPQTESESSDIVALTRENNRLLLENNEMLKKMERRYVRGFWLKLVWFVVLFILPLLFLPYFFNTYLQSLGLSGDSDGSPAASSGVSDAQKILDLLQNN